MPPEQNDGQAATLAPFGESLDDIGAFLDEHPDADSSQERADQPADTGEDDGSRALAPRAQQRPAPSDDDKSPAPDPDDSEGGLADVRPSSLFKVTIKGDDGADQQIEVDEQELVRGYLRHSDYTRQRQSDSQRESVREAEVAKERREGREYFLTQAQTVRTAIQRLAGFKSLEELQVLAATDPAAYGAETVRMQRVQQTLAEVEQSIMQEVEKAKADADRAHQEAVRNCWLALGREGINKEKLSAIFERVISDYDVPRERFQRIDDPRLIFIMRDAIRWRDAVKRRDSLKKPNAAPARSMPTARNAPPPSQAKQQADRRIKSGKGDLRDLARFV